MADIAAFAGIGLALYVGHHVGDYWVQTDHDAAHKGADGREGVIACARHCGTYVLTQGVFLALVLGVTGAHVPWYQGVLALLVSFVFHYAADRREHGIMFRLARLIPGKANFLRLGVPRAYEIYARPTDSEDARGPIPLDNPSLGTGAWALDQSWHLATSVFLPALIMCL